MKNYISLDPCLACGKCEPSSVCYHHIKSRGAGGLDVDYNLMSLCKRHHAEVHQIGLKSFSQTYASVYMWLKYKDWYICPASEKWVHDLNEE